MQFNYVQSPFMRALIRKYEFERDEAIANLNVFFSNSSGVAEHSDFVGTMDKWLTQLSDSEGKLKSLVSHFANQPQPTATATPTDPQEES
ncbi:hypothetical protein EB151_00115 [archaeon]|nr:hypothetical protein [archaeon]